MCRYARASCAHNRFFSSPPPSAVCRFRSSLLAEGHDQRGRAVAVPGVFLVNLRKLVVPQTHLRQLCCTNKDEVGTLSQEADRRGKEKRETEKTRQAWKDGKSEGRNISVDRLRRKHARTATMQQVMAEIASDRNKANRTTPELRLPRNGASRNTNNTSICKKLLGYRAASTR